MQFFALSTGVLTALLFSVITAGSPTCTIPPIIHTSYPKHQLVTYNPSNATVDGKLVHMPIIFGIPESPPPIPLVIYSPTVPEGNHILNATLKGTRLYNQFSSSRPARVAASERNGLSAVYFQSGPQPAGTIGAFHVIAGCDIKGNRRQELWPAKGQFCVRTGKWKPSLEIMIKYDSYVQPKNDPNPCVDVALVTKLIQ